MQTLKDKTAVITGAGSGIGRAIALALADAGTRMVVGDIQQDAAEAVAAEVRARGADALAVMVDVASRESVAELADRAYARFGSVDVLCSNAGVSWRPFRNVMDATLEDWRYVFGINVFGLLNCNDVFLKRMCAQPGEKHIVVTASLASMFPHEGHAPYSASKAAVASIAEVMASELAPYGFGVTIICPGSVRTNLGENAVRLRGAVPDEQASRFAPVDTKMVRRMSTFATPSPEPIGTMVRNAILDNTLYLHTHAVPMEMVAERVNIQFGPATVGKA
jgi:NAD(P)-dependent dehydrogenase (short-subunit alcohol dehydrogenase family)